MLTSNSNSTTESSHNRPILGMIGCGNIGGRQAANFLAHGYEVYVYDINPDSMAELESLGAHITDSCAEVAISAQVIFTSLPTPTDVISAVIECENNLCQELQPGSIYVDITTNSVETVLKLDQTMEELGVEMLDAPFNDCPVGAQSQKGMGLAVLTGGSKETFDKVEPLLQLMADNVLYCGEISSGTKCKLIHNAVNAIAVQGVSEGITLGLASSIKLQTIWDTLRLGSFAQNPGDIHGLPHYWFSRRCDDISQHPAFNIKLLHKDLRLALNMARERNIKVPHLSLSIKDFEEAERRGWSQYSTTKVCCLQEERAKVTAEATLPLVSDPNYTPTVTKDSTIHKARFSLFAVLILVLASNLFQFGLHWLFHFI